MTVKQFITMGGYGFYVWSAYVVVWVSLTILWVHTQYQYKKARKKIT